MVTLAVKHHTGKHQRLERSGTIRRVRDGKPQHIHTSYTSSRRQGGEKTSPYPQKLPWTLVLDPHLCLNQLLL